MSSNTLNSHMGRIIAAVRRNISRLDTKDREILLAEFEWWYKYSTGAKGRGRRKDMARCDPHTTICTWE